MLSTNHKLFFSCQKLSAILSLAILFRTLSPACPNGALSRDEATGVITVDEAKCTSQGACVEACIYHSIRLHPESKKPMFCDLCGGDPYCVKHCVPEAISWVDKTEDNEKLKKKLRSARMAKYRKLKEAK